MGNKRTIQVLERELRQKDQLIERLLDRLMFLSGHRDYAPKQVSDETETDITEPEPEDIYIKEF